MLKVADGDPGSYVGGCVADLPPGGCAGGGCVSVVDSGGKFTVSLQPQLSGTFGSFSNINTSPTMKLVFNDPSGNMTLSTLSGHVSSLSAVQFPTLGVSGSSGSDTWHPTVISYNVQQSSSSTSVPVMESWWLLPGVLAGMGFLIRRRKA